MSIEPYRCSTCSNMRGIGSWPICPDHGKPGGAILIASIHKSERATIYVNPRTGERRIPAEANVAMPAVYARQGFERLELDTAQKRNDFERKTGLVHERSNFDVNTGSAERSLMTGIESAPNTSSLDEG